jgi:hypothetical protein
MYTHKNQRLLKHLRPDPELLKELEEECMAVLRREQGLVLGRLDALAERLAVRVREQRVVFRAVVGRLDDWIIFGTKKETDLTYNTIKALRTAILESRACHYVIPLSEPISQSYQPLTFSRTLTQLPAVDPEDPASLAQIKQLYE